MEKEEKDILEEIRDCYNNGLLSALVGAGFSKNVSDSFLGWGELLHEMVGTLYAIEIKKNYDNYIHQNRGTRSKRKTEKEIGDEYIKEVSQKEDYLEIVSNYIRKKVLENLSKFTLKVRYLMRLMKIKLFILVEIYQSSKSNISEHLTNIFADKELDQDAVVRKFRTTAADGKNYQVLHYNLDVIIALGYRVQSIMC